MKLVIAIVQDQDQNILSHALLEANIRATKWSRPGGFLRSGNTTFLLGVEDHLVDEVLDIIKSCSESREQYISSPIHLDVSLDISASYPIRVEVGGATVFVLPIDSFHQF